MLAVIKWKKKSSANEDPNQLDDINEPNQQKEQVMLDDEPNKLDQNLDDKSVSSKD